MTAPAAVDKVIWIDQGWQPVFIGWCPSKKAWDREMRKFGVTDEPYPDSSGRCTMLESKTGNKMRAGHAEQGGRRSPL
jgi:hypothetical protein